MLPGARGNWPREDPLRIQKWSMDSMLPDALGNPLVKILCALSDERYSRVPMLPDALARRREDPLRSQRCSMVPMWPDALGQAS